MPLARMDRKAQRERIRRLTEEFPATTRQRRVIRAFVKECCQSLDIVPPVIDVGSGYRSNEPEVCADGLLDYYTLDLNPSTGADFILDGAAMTGIPDRVFGVALCTELLEHVRSPQDVVREIWRVLRQGGLFIVTVPFAAPIHEKAWQPDYWRFTPDGLRLLLKDFHIIRLQTEGDDELAPLVTLAAAVKQSRSMQECAAAV